ncbi:hypothetical protein AB6A40_004113 [Gnathostoma spinigerum]|uniref:DUF1508 domain-containing protein n=1 Tax=Gnathostoma spinigerum TaxID=75299 RepID=A0ABD6EJ78_9BILA
MWTTSSSHNPQLYIKVVDGRKIRWKWHPGDGKRLLWRSKKMGSDLKEAHQNIEGHWHIAVDCAPTE